MIEFDLLPFFISLALMAIVVLWIGVLMRKHVVAMAVIIPLVLGSTFVSYTTIEGLLGYPIRKQLAEESVYLYHIEGANGDYLFVWVIEPGDFKPRALTFANTKENREQAEQAKQGKAEGVPQKLVTLPGNGQTRNGDFQVYDFNPMQHVSKDSPQTSPPQYAE
jgi:hypothetical protein